MRRSAPRSISRGPCAAADRRVRASSSTRRFHVSHLNNSQFSLSAFADCFRLEKQSLTAFKPAHQVRNLEISMNRLAKVFCVVFAISVLAITNDSALANEPHVGRWKLVITDSKGRSLTATAIVKRSEGTIVTSDKRHGKLTDFRFAPPSPTHPHGSMQGRWVLVRMSGSFSVHPDANRNEFRGTLSINGMPVATVRGWRQSSAR